MPPRWALDSPSAAWTTAGLTQGLHCHAATKTTRQGAAGWLHDCGIAGHGSYVMGSDDAAGPGADSACQVRNTHRDCGDKETLVGGEC